MYIVHVMKPKLMENITPISDNTDIQTGPYASEITPARGV